VLVRVERAATRIKLTRDAGLSLVDGNSAFPWFFCWWIPERITFFATAGANLPIISSDARAFSINVVDTGA
jgi:hypothetical protein